jgi:autotransporter beta-domain protein
MQKPSPVHRLLTLAALLAALPAAAAPNNITDLGTLRSDNSGISHAFGFNSDSSIVVGTSYWDGGRFGRATVWSGSNWATKTDLGTLKSDNTGSSTASGTNGDGSVVVGASDRDGSGSSHATVWSGSGWATKTALGTLRTDNTGYSSANAISSDGSVVVGSADNDRSQRATVWSGSGWATKTDLGTLRSDNSGISYANAVNGDGSVVVGSSDIDIGNDYTHAIVWSGSGWTTKTDLGTLRSDNSWNSHAVAVSSDGSLVFGDAHNDNGDYRATVWSGSGWATKTDLGTLKSDNSGESKAFAASSDGSMVAGRADNDNGDYRATVWSGSGWATKTDLGTLKTDNSGVSSVEAISADGKFALGWAINDNGDRHAAVWNLRSLNIRAADTANTRASLSLLSADTASLLAQRARAAENLLGGCRADGGKFCYSAGYRRDIGHGASSRGADFAFGYGISDNFDAAVSLAVPARAEENGSHRLKSGVGIGLSARLHNGAGWYAVPAAAFETDKTRIRRPHLNGTESPENTVRTKGRAYSLTAGRDYGTPGEKTLGWYAALRRTEAERPSYSEDAGLSFPFAYGAAKLKETSLAAGIKGRLPLTGKLAWYGNAEVAQRVGGGKARFTASAPFFGAFEEARETTRTRPSVQTGVDYAFSPSAVLSLGGYIGRNAFSGTDKGMFLKLNGKF